MSSVDMICPLQECGRYNNNLTHHFADGVLGLIELLPGSVDQAFGVLDSPAGTVGLGVGVVHGVPDVL